MAEWFLVFFGHFYQPPRFNPWAELVDLDPSAKPFHDWNERVTLKCYSKLPSTPLYDGDGWIAVVNIYSEDTLLLRPALLEWLKAKLPKIYNAIVEAGGELCLRGASETRSPSLTAGKPRLLRRG